MALARVIPVACLAAWLAGGCTRPCALELKQHFYLAPPVATGGAPSAPQVVVPCCGGSVQYDIDLTPAGVVEVDITNPNAAGVDGFLTSVECPRLFAGPYQGPGTTPLCATVLGPVTPGTTSPRVKIPPGQYRMVAQAYASNPSPMSVSLDLGVWSAACRWLPLAN